MSTILEQDSDRRLGNGIVNFVLLVPESLGNTRHRSLLRLKSHIMLQVQYFT